MIDSLLSVLFGGMSGATLVWLLRGWITERLKQSIAHEYSEKLQSHKTDLDAKLQTIRHQYEVTQLRTSLFFEHQRAAFAQLLGKVAEINRQWWDDGYDAECGLSAPVPSKPYSELKALYFQHQLFLDSECLMAMELVFEIYEDSFPFDNGSGEPPIERDVGTAYNNIEYLHPRIAALFRQKIGLATDPVAVRQIALLGAIRILNQYHFQDIALPVRGSLRIRGQNGAAEAVMTAERNQADLVAKMQEFSDYLKTETSFFHEAQTKLSRYLAALDGRNPYNEGSFPLQG